ncbi:hypothetical protein GDO86_012166 [Hymenochirus boettgeri]|uniref:Uncharacterized protein n=1 Tax=Hymenochirus boettgeri TaxID=247094 RepID=A0A8T2IL86_9PIPI|nr:hypothetical protein GDO86_012166 [Hymenochirus boettgeri]
MLLLRGAMQPNQRKWFPDLCTETQLGVYPEYSDCKDSLQRYKSTCIKTASGFLPHFCWEAHIILLLVILIFFKRKRYLDLD